MLKFLTWVDLLILITKNTEIFYFILLLMFLKFREINYPASSLCIYTVYEK